MVECKYYNVDIKVGCHSFYNTLLILQFHSHYHKVNTTMLVLQFEILSWGFKNEDITVKLLQGG